MVSIAEFTDDGKYNIKVLSERTGVRPVTLRAWERRYDLLDPDRQDNNYRLYSERDVQIIRWITHRLDEGLSISNAVKAYKNLRTQGIWPDALPSVLIPERKKEPKFPPKTYTKKLYKAFVNHDQAQARAIMDSVQSMFELKTIFFEIMQPCLYEIGEAWVRGEIRIATEHFASNFIQGILSSLLLAFPVYYEAPKILVGCPQDEFHVIAPLMLAVLLRREGYQVEFLGADLPVDDLVAYAEDTTPEMIILSSSNYHSTFALYKMQEKLNVLPNPPVFGFGGRYYIEDEKARQETQGIFLGFTLDEAIEKVHQLLD